MFMYICFMDSQEAQKRRNDMKKFLQSRRKQMTNIKKSEQSTELLKQAIAQDQPDEFKTNLATLSPQTAFDFLFSEDDLRRSALSLMTEQARWIQFFEQVTEWSLSNSQLIEAKTSALDSDELQLNFMRTKYLNLLRDISCKVSKEKSIEHTQKLIEMFGKKGSLFNKYSQQYLTLQAIVKTAPEESLLDLLQSLYDPIFSRLSNEVERNETGRLVMMKRKEDLWTNGNFEAKIDEPDLLVLKELNYSCIHDLVLNRNEPQLYSILERLEAEGGAGISKTRETIFSAYSTSGQTPLDLILKKWEYKSIMKFLARTEEMDEINFTVNSLNEIINNFKLNQAEVQELIGIFLSKKYLNRGFSQQVINEVSQKRGKKIIRGSIVVFDKKSLLTAKKNTVEYPLLAYVNRFKGTGKLNVVESLFFKDLERKNVKNVLISGLKLFGVEETKFESESEGTKQIEQVVAYHQPLLEVISGLPPGDLINFFIDKLFINCFTVSYLFYTKRGQDKQKTIRIQFARRHFLEIYAAHQSDLSENETNKKILDKIKTLKDTERSIKDFNFYANLLKSFYYDQKLRKNEQWLVLEVKNWVKDNLKLIPKQQLGEMYVKKQDQTVPVSTMIQIVFGVESARQMDIPGWVEAVGKKTPLKTYNKKWTLENFLLLLENPQKYDSAEHPLIKNRQIKLKFDEPHLNQKIRAVLSKGLDAQIISRHRTLDPALTLQIIETLDTPIRALVETMISPKSFGGKAWPKSKNMYLSQAFLYCNDENVEDCMDIIAKADGSFLEHIYGNMTQYTCPPNPLMLLALWKKYSGQFRRIRDEQNRKKQQNGQYVCQQDQVVDINHILSGYLNYIERVFKFESEPEKKQLVLKKFIRCFNSFKGEFGSPDSQLRQIKQTLIKSLSKHSQQFNLADLYREFPFEDYFAWVTSDPEDSYEDSFYDEMSLNYLRLSQNPLQFYKKIIKTFSQWKRPPTEPEPEPEPNEWGNKYSRQQGTIKDFMHKEKIAKFYAFILPKSDQQFEQFLNESIAIPIQRTIDYQYMFQHTQEISKLLIVFQKYINSNEPSQALLMQLIKTHPKTMTALALPFIDPEHTVKIPFVSDDRFWLIDQAEYYSKCKEEDFSQLLQYLAQAMKKQNFRTQKLIQILLALYQKHCWNRLIALVKLEKEEACWIPFLQTAFDYCSSDMAKAKNYSQKKEYQQFVKMLFEKLALFSKGVFHQQIFCSSFALDPQAIVEIMQPKELSLISMAKCISKNPSGVKVLQQLAISESDIPAKFDASENRRLFPLHSYSKNDFEKLPWLVDLLILESKLHSFWRSKAQNIEKYTKVFANKKKTAFLIKNVMDRFSEVYTPEEIKQFCPLVFSSNSLRSLKEVPKEYVDCYFKNYPQVKHIRNVNESVIRELIDQGHLKPNHLEEILKTGSLPLVKYFLEKFKISLAKGELQKVQSDYLKNRTVIELMASFGNSSYASDFIRHFKLFDQYENQKIEQLSQQLLVSITIYRATSVLELLVIWLNSKHKKINYRWEDDQNKGIKGNQVFLPKQAAVENHFYEYLFLEMSTEGQLFPKHEGITAQHQIENAEAESEEGKQAEFEISSRFKMGYNPEEYKFIPEMHRRLVLLKNLEDAIPSCKEDKIYYSYVLPTLFGISAHSYSLVLVDRQNKRLVILIVCAIAQKFDLQLLQAFMTRENELRDNITCSLLQLKANPNITFPTEALRKMCPIELETLEKVLSICPIKLGESDRAVFTGPLAAINVQILLSHPKYFFSREQCREDFVNNPLIYQKAFFPLLNLLQTEEHIEMTKKTFDRAFFSRRINYGQKELSYLKQEENCFVEGKSYCEFLNRTILLVCVGSWTEGTGEIFNYFLKKNQEEKAPEDFIFQLAERTNSIYDKCYYSHGFWVKIQEELDAYKRINPHKAPQKNRLKTSYKWLDQKRSFEGVDVALEEVQSGKSGMEAAFSLLRNHFYLLTEHERLTDCYQYGDIKLKLGRQLLIKQLEQKEKGVGEQAAQERKQQQIQLEITIPYEIEKRTISMLRVGTPEILQKIEYAGFFNKFFRESNEMEFFNCLGKLTFSFNSESFKQLKSVSKLKSLLEERALSSNGFSAMQRLGEILQDKVSDLTAGCSSLSDVDGPILINESTNKSEASEYLSFYNLVDLPDSRIEISYLESGEVKEGASKVLSDIWEYIRFFENEITDDQDKNNTPYKFNSKLYMTISSSDRVSIVTDEFYPYNIVSFLSLLGGFGQELTNYFGNSVTIKFDAKSILTQVVKKNNKLQTGKDIHNFVSQFIRGPANKALLQEVLFMIIEDATNIMKVVKGVLLTYKKGSPGQEDRRNQWLKLGDGMFAYKLVYEIKDSIFKIVIMTCSECEKEPAANVEESQLVSRKSFFDAIFSSAEFLTDYFLNKPKITAECVRISTELSKKLNTTINYSVDYKILYAFVGRLKEKSAVREIDHFLSELNRYILANSEKFINNYLASKGVALTHQLLMANKFQSLKEGISLEDVYRQNALTYNSCSINNRGLSLVKAITGEVKSEGSEVNLKNMFLIQVYKSYFSNMVREGMSVILGSKSGRPPTIIRLQKKEDIDKVNIVELAYLLLVASQIPSNDEIDHSKIIRVFVTDLSENVYQIDQQVHNKLLALPDESDDRNLADLVPVIQPNIILSFQAEDLQAKDLRDDKEHKYLSLELNEKMVFKIKPKDHDEMSASNCLKIDPVFNEMVGNFSKLVSQHIRDRNIQISIEIPPKSAPHTTLEYIKFLFYDFETSLNNIFNDPLRNPALETFLSVEKRLDIRQSAILTFKKAAFSYDKIHIVCIPEGKPSIEVKANSIKIYLSLVEGGTAISSKTITSAIIADMITKIYDAHPPLKNIVSCPSDETIQLNVLEVLSYANYQIESVNQALSLFKVASKESEGAPTSIKINMVDYSGMSLLVEGKELCLSVGLQCSSRPFFSTRDVLSFLLNKNQEVPDSSTSTRFLLENQIIEVNNYREVNKVKILLVGAGKAEVRDYQLKTDPSNPTRAFLPWSEPGFTRYYLLQKEESHVNVFGNYFWSMPSLPNLISSEKAAGLINTQYNLVLVSPKPINLNECTAFYKTLLPNQEKADTVSLLASSASIKLLSEQVLVLTVESTFSCTISLYFECYHMLESNIQKCHISIGSDKSMVVSNTKFLELVFRGKTIVAKSIYESDQIQKNLLFREPAEKALMKEGKQEQAKVDAMIYIVNENAKKYLTRAGEDRIDVINFCDDEGNPLHQSAEQLDIYFKHMNLEEIIRPQITQDAVRVELKWRPTIRGPYEIYIEGIRLNPDYELGVCAAYADLKFSKLETPKKIEICYSEESECTLALKDSFENIYTQLEESIIGDPLLIEMLTDGEGCKLLIKNENINKYGLKKLRFSVDDPTASEEKSINITVLLNKEEIGKFMLKIKGQALKQRKKNVEEDIRKFQKHQYSKSVVINRNNFLDGLFKIAEASLQTNLSIKFQGEDGIDAGGLKREFYDMIGNVFKKASNPFFKPTDSNLSEYFINPEIMNNKKRDEYFALLGKYLANSILNGYLIGVKFSPVFVKLLYNDTVDFEDLLAVLPKEEANRYTFLLSATQEDFESLELYFTATVNRKKLKEVELIEGGKDIKVNSQNVKEYLEKLSHVLLSGRYEQLMESFRQGFDSVIKIEWVRRWIRPDEFWCLTAGVKNLTPEDVIDYVVFQGGMEKQNGWFRRYILESNQEVLEGFLKFSSGSSSIDYDKTSKVTVNFQKAGDNPKRLPISHTCWKQIVVPAYKSYDVMKTLLNAAFLFCSEGFGFG